MVVLIIRKLIQQTSKFILLVLKNDLFFYLKQAVFMITSTITWRWFGYSNTTVPTIFLSIK